MAKKYIPNAKEKYMCERQKTYFKKRLMDWRNEIVESNSKGLYLNEIDHEISSPDIVDQATSQTEKTVEMRTLNRQIKLLSKICFKKKRQKIKTSVWTSNNFLVKSNIFGDPGSIFNIFVNSRI